MAVVGAGLLGSATARALAARGRAAVLFEQFGLGHARGSSHGATRIFRYSYPDPCYVEMAVRAGEAWAPLAADAGEELLVRTGGLDAGPGAEDCATALAECGVEHAWLTGAQVRDRFPGIAARPGERMLFQPDSGVSLAGRTVAALQRLARRDGAAIRAGTPVLGIEAGRDQVLLRTAAGEVTARAAVITAGPLGAGLLAGALPQAPAADGHGAAGAVLRAAGSGRRVADADRVAGHGAELVRGARRRRRPRGEGRRAHPRPAGGPGGRPVHRIDPALEGRRRVTCATACLAWTRPGWPRRPACTR